MFICCALYHFVTVEEPQALRDPLLALMELNGLRGTLLLANEGINGTVAGTRAGIDALISFLRRDTRFADIRCEESLCSTIPFHRARVKLKKEIVTMGVPEIDPTAIVGTYVEPSEWNSVIEDPAVTLIDTRNDYEVRIGTFENAVNPRTKSFRDFPRFARNHLDRERHEKIAMFCTGGIRCEKSTAYLKSLGFDTVYHLRGGILKYLEVIPETESLWRGECFVFDGRVTVTHGLAPGHYEQCHACRMPLGVDDKTSSDYVPGVSCPHCIDKYTATDRRRFFEREKQVRLAQARGDEHLGYGAAGNQARRKQEKRARRIG